MGEFSVSTFQSKNNLHSIELANLNFTYQKLRDHITVDYLSFRGVELDSILNRKKFSIDSISLFKPKINISYRDLKQQSNQGHGWSFSKIQLIFY